MTSTLLTLAVVPVLFGCPVRHRKAASTVASKDGGGTPMPASADRD
jgi:hypothetical protein